MKQYQDDELGTISVKSHHMARSIRMRLSPRGDIVVTTPPRTPLFLVKRAVATSRNSLETMKLSVQNELYHDSQPIGHSHKLAVIRTGANDRVSVAVSKRVIVVRLPESKNLENSEVQGAIREQVVRVLRKEAKAYLPKRLQTLAERYGFSYTTVRFPHAISRWGSCSSSGTISLNIALMRLELDLIDYVILHELTHTVHMNHSAAFWSALGSVDPSYKLHRNRLRAATPVI